MSVPTVACTNCGKPFTTDDLRGTSCRYCGTLLAHHARAAQQVAVVNQMLADRNGNGIPDAFEGLAANAQANAYKQAFGGPPYGQPLPPYGQPMPPPANVMIAQAHMQAVNMQVQQASSAASRVVVFVLVGVILAFVLFGALLAFFVIGVAR